MVALSGLPDMGRYPAHLYHQGNRGFGSEMVEIQLKFLRAPATQAMLLEDASQDGDLATRQYGSYRDMGGCGIAFIAQVGSSISAKYGCRAVTWILLSTEISE